MKVTVVIHNLTRKSGEGSVVFAAIEMLQERGVEFSVSTFSRPREDYGFPVRHLLPFSLSRFDRYQRLLVWLSARRTRADVYLNFTGVPIPLSGQGTHVIYGGASPFGVTKYSRSLFWRLYRSPFKLTLRFLKDEARRAKFIANSRYSAKAIKELYGVEAKVIYPPVDVEDFYKAFHDGGNYFLTIARIERGKSIEKAVILSHRTKIPGVIVGYLSDERYYKELLELRSKLGADVKFVVNASREQVIEAMKGACCYFHPTVGEHFGIPVVEAMAAGLVPVVPLESGAAEVVPEFAYSTIEEAEEKLVKAYREHSARRFEMRERASTFNKSRFKEELWNYILDIIGKK